ncbi:MAG TPA: beta-propeller domain-containing protein [Candidatus Angelobacter sp.]|nr:beta-propeller domain-containing protein [Candidatus Angelobacter sp.]
MKAYSFRIITTALLIAGLAGCAGASGANSASAGAESATKKNSYAAKKTMRAFRSEAELKSYFHEIAERQKAEARRFAEMSNSMPAPSALASADKAGNGESVTNVQHAGVDEGGIVKVHGNHLVMLRRGRLFTVAIGDGALEPVSAVDAYAPDVDPSGTWYDEMLVSGDTIAVIGYSYSRGGTEVNLFQIDAAGMLSYKSTYHLRSNDYYSSRNYASRLIGSKLIFYSPLYINTGLEDPYQSFPAVRKWHKGARQTEFKRIVSATEIYRTERPLGSRFGTVLHTVTICDLARGEFDCKATSVLGPPGRVFYVSPESVYVWVNDWVESGPQWRAQSIVYRMPLDGSGPSALNVSGSPVDQFSFLESEDGHLNVLVRSDTAGDGMWGAEVAAGDVALMRVPLASFSDGNDTAPLSSYRRLPKPAGYTFQNRFVGDYLLYGTGSGWGYPQKARQANLYAVRWAGGGPHQLSLRHGVDRIEQLGNDALVVGTDGNNLHFTAVRLGRSPELADEYVRKDASQGELRSQGFFYKPDGPNSGLLGLPISRAGRVGYAHLIEGSAAILFLRNDSLHFQEMGELGAGPKVALNDGCRASCVDWYGNARPLFLRGRYIALLGYELVEGSMDEGQIHEMRRVSYAPGSVQALRK